MVEASTRRPRCALALSQRLASMICWSSNVHSVLLFSPKSLPPRGRYLSDLRTAILSLLVGHSGCEHNCQRSMGLRSLRAQLSHTYARKRRQSGLLTTHDPALTTEGLPARILHRLRAMYIASCFALLNTAAPISTETAVSSLLKATSLTQNVSIDATKHLQKRVLPGALSAQEFEQRISVGMAVTKLCLLAEHDASALLGADSMQRIGTGRSATRSWTRLSTGVVQVAPYRELLNNIGQGVATGPTET
jgi:hypothetical protein